MKQDKTTGQSKCENYCYYYLHQNGDLIYMDKNSLEDDFDVSDLVLTWWKIDLKNRADIYHLLIRARILGAHTNRIYELVNKWGITNADAENFVKYVGLVFALQGSKYIIRPKDDKDYAPGRGNTMFEALCDFYKKAVSK